MDYTGWAERHLHPDHITVSGKKVAVYRTEHSAEKPTLWLLHGITGDRYGLVPLISELAPKYNCVVVELPGHGRSDLLSLRSGYDLQAWWSQVAKTLEKKYGRSTATIAHSFGCLAVANQQSGVQIMLNPVPTPTAVYARYARTMKRTASVVGLIYNMRWFVWLRVLSLSKNHDRQAKRNVRWVSKSSWPSYRQFAYQTKLTSMLTDEFGRIGSYEGVELVIVGLGDTSAIERDTLDYRQAFGYKTILYFLRGGHLLPIEDPVRVAELVDSYLTAKTGN